MSSRRERRKKLFETPRQPAPLVQSRVSKRIVQERTRDVSSLGHTPNRQMRTLSPRTIKVIFLAVIILIVLLFLTPKPPAPPGGQTQDMTTGKLSPINLSTVRTTIPPIKSSTDSAFGSTFKDKLNTK